MFQVLLVLHTLAAIVFVGNIITAAFWKSRADRSGNPETIAATAQAILLADYVFTVPGAVGLVVTGTLMIAMTDWARFEEPWLASSLALLLLTGAIWLGILVPLQQRMVELSRQGVTRGALDPSYTRASRRWALFGGIATALPIVVLVLMVLKPGS